MPVNLPVSSGVAFPPVFHRSQGRQVGRGHLRWCLGDSHVSIVVHPPQVDNNDKQFHC